jgi:hypothetical protein
VSITAALATRLVLAVALAFLSLVAFGGMIAVPAEGAAIRWWGRDSRGHRAVNGLLYGLCGATVLSVLYVAGFRGVG